jgi:hypothetical protein
MKIVAITLAQSLLLPSFALPIPTSVRMTEWNILMSIPQGQHLLVQPKTGKKVEGKLQSATESNLELRVKGSVVSFGSADVQRVYWLKGRRMAMGTLIGAGVGAGSGAAVGALTHRESNWLDFGRGFDAAVVGGIGLVLGAAVGLIIGSSWRKKELVYESPKG